MNIDIKHPDGTLIRLHTKELNYSLFEIDATYYGRDGYYKAGLSYKYKQSRNQFRRDLISIEDNGAKVTIIFPNGEIKPSLYINL